MAFFFGDQERSLLQKLLDAGEIDAVVIEEEALHYEGAVDQMDERLGAGFRSAANHSWASRPERIKASSAAISR